MKRLVILMSILSLLARLGLIPTLAEAKAQAGESLHQAVLDADIGRVQSLTSAGADVNARDKAGFTPLFYTAQKGQRDIAAVLITAGASVSATDQYGNTPLHYAAVQGHYELCQLLLAEGANPGAKNLTGGTPLAMAKAGGHTQIIQLLSSSAPGGPTLANAGDATRGPQSKAPATDYIAELNKLGIAGRPESDNAAPYLQKAIELYVEEGATPVAKNWSQPNELNPQERAALQSWLQANSGALGQLELAGQKSYCWFKYTPETLETDTARLPRMRQLTFALAARAMLKADDGDVTGALTDAATIYRVGSLAAAAPKPLVGKLVGNAIKAVAVKAVFTIINDRPLDARLMSSVQSQLESFLATYDEPFDLRGERLVTEYNVETQPAGQLFRGHIKAAFDYFDALVQKTPWQLFVEKIKPEEHENPFVKQVGSGIARAAEVEYRNRAETQGLVATIAAMRYKAEKGQYPATLEQLVSAGYLKELPKDPYSDKPLVYRQTAANFMIYSCGPDFDDDGGASYGPQGGDRVFWPRESSKTAQTQTTRQQYIGRTPDLGPTGVEQPYRPTERAMPANSAATEMLHVAVVGGKVGQVESALANGADVNGKDKRGWPPLHVAVWYKQKDIAEVLIAKGADVNAEESQGYTALHLAAIKGATDVVDPLIAKGADINAQDRAGQTPLYLAVQYGYKDLVQLLIAKGADVNAQTRGDDNPLSLARKKQRNDFVELLLEHGAKEPVSTVQERLYGAEQGPEGPSLYAGPQQQARMQTGAATQSATQVDMASVLADPNEIKARISTFEGLEKELAQVDRRSRLEIGEWLQTRVDNRLKLAKSVELQIRAEISCVRTVAVEEKAKKTTAAIDELLTNRQSRFRTLVKTMEDELKGRRPTRSTRGGYRGRYSGARTRYTQDGRAVEAQGGYMAGGAASMGTPGAPAGYGAAREIQVSEWMQGPDNRTSLANAVQEQVMAELTPIRTIAVGEGAKKTTAAIDGVLLSRKERLGQLTIKMGGGPAGMPGGYPGAAGSTTDQGAYPLRPRRR